MKRSVNILFGLCAAILITSGGVCVSGQTPTAPPAVTIGPQAVKFILKNFTINPEAVDSNTHQPLHTNGSWSISKNHPALCPETTQMCVEVFYTVSAQSAKCSWVVSLNESGTDGAVLDENDDAAKYMLRTVSGSDAKSFIKSRQKPVFPPLGAVLGAKGPVTLWALVDTSGEVQNVRVVSGPPPFQSASVDAAKKWNFKPMMIGSRAVPYEIQLVFTFLPLNPTSGYVQVTP